MLEWSSSLRSAAALAALKPMLHERIEHILKRRTHAVLLHAWELITNKDSPTCTDAVRTRAKLLSLLRDDKHRTLPLALANFDTIAHYHGSSLNLGDLSPEGT
ncbi:hypothetical protein C8Q76DRAFT_194722 [Earliella scabrosa]|nr:hypothetical protein C8Q76DRAFT_194722 [Earliella scabrosa]